jgi:hypothetical protein
MMTLVQSEVTEGRYVAGAERRRGLRIRQARPVRVLGTCGAKYYGGQTEDISATGLRVELPASAPVQPGTVVNVHVGGALANRKQLMPARIVWVDRSFTRGYAIAGIEFIASIASHLDAA